jgi:hypothetical protein
MTIAAPIPSLDHDDVYNLHELHDLCELKEFLIFRLDTREGDRELADESALLAEAEH